MPLASSDKTSAPVAGEAGSVTVIGLAVVFSKIWSPSTAVYSVIIHYFNVIYPCLRNPKLTFVPSE